MLRKRFENKIVLITGGANGLGRGMAEQYLKEGAKLAIFDIEDDTRSRSTAEWKAFSAFTAT